MYSIKNYKDLLTLCLKARGPEGGPSGSDPDPNPNAPPTPKSQEPIPIPEELEKKVLDQTLKDYGINLEEFYRNTKVVQDLVKGSLTDDQKVIQEKARLLFQEYLKTNPSLDKLTLKTLTDSTNSEIIKNLSNKFEAHFNEKFKEYKFLDNQTKEFLKIGMIKSIVEGGMLENAESIMGSFYELAKDGFQALKGKNLKDPPELSGRLKKLVDDYTKYIDGFTKKFDEIQGFFAVNNITDKEQQQAIISHVDWFRSPELIAKGIEGLDVNSIDIKKTERKSLTPEEYKKISDFMLEARDGVVNLANISNALSNAIYDLTDKGGESTEGFLKLLLKLPLIGPLLAMFLGLNPETAAEEFAENMKSRKLFATLKGLGKSGDKEGQGIFGDIDTSELEFKEVKGEMGQITSLFPELKTDGYQDFWNKAFSEEGYGTGDIKFKLKLPDGKNKFTNTDLAIILQNGITEYKQKVNPEVKAGAEEETVREKEEAQRRLNAIKIIEGDEKLWNAESGNDNYTKYKSIKLSDIKEVTDDKIEEILKSGIKEGYDALNSELKQALKDSIIIIRDYIKDKKLTVEGNKTIGEFMEDKDFKNFINQEKIAAENLLNTTSKPATSLTETETGTEVTAASTTATPKTTAPTTAEA